VEISEIKATDSSLEVSVTESQPGPHCLLTMALTQPFHLVSFPRWEKPVTLRQSQRVEDCLELPY
jgi:hypothetical protein